MEDCNLLGARLDDTKLENTQWNKNYILINEKEAIDAAKKKNKETAQQKYKEAEEIYRNIKLSHRNQGHGKDESPFFHREMVVQRKQMPMFSRQRFFSKFMDLTTGYGEKPQNVVAAMLCNIVISAFFYGFLGVQKGGVYLGFCGSDIPLDKLAFNLLYFSTVVFTTVGFGDITPLGASKFIMMLQGLSGQITIAFFIVALYKKLMSR